MQNQPKTAGFFKSICLSICAIFYMIDTCGRATWKNFIGNITRDWCDKELQRWSLRLINLFKIKVTIINPTNTAPIPGETTIIMCNHTSLLDIPLSLRAFPQSSIRMLAKKELRNIPIMGKGMIAADFPFIDRNNRRQAIQDLASIQKLLQSGITLWMAPEGTRSKSGLLGPFKKGGFITAIQTKATIIPIVIQGAHQILPAKTFKFHLQKTAKIYVGNAINASLYSMRDKHELMKKVRDTMEQLL